MLKDLRNCLQITCGTIKRLFNFWRNRDMEINGIIWFTLLWRNVWLVSKLQKYFLLKKFLIFCLFFLLGALLANQDNMEFNYKCNTFELYGADFLLSYDLKPWLIEINSSPALGATTQVTARMCSMMLEDIVKVTVDRRKGRNADTGGFELIYKQNMVQPPLFVGTSLCVQGMKIAINHQPKG